MKILNRAAKAVALSLALLSQACILVADDGSVVGPGTGVIGLDRTREF